MKRRAGSGARPSTATLPLVTEPAGMFIAAAALLGALVVIRFTAPIFDGDLFWHLAYARQMLADATLIPDATRYSWTPAADTMIYCAWLAELVLYGLWQLGDEFAMHALRYAVVAAIVALLWLHAARNGLGRSVWTPLVILLVLAASAAIPTAKPELFSVLFTHVLLWLYHDARRADANGGPVGALLWCVPLLLLVWVNSHGGFILAAPLVAAWLVGDLVNRRFAPAHALSMRARRVLWLTALVAACTTLVTPYGWAYPWQLIADHVFAATPRPDGVWNTAYQSAFSADGWRMWLPQYGAAMLLILGWLGWRAHRSGTPLDAVAVLLVVATVPLYIVFLRAGYLLPAVFGYVVLVLLGALNGRPAPDARRGAQSRMNRGHPAAVVAVVFAALLVSRNAWEAFYRPPPFSWFGFGINHVNPVEEAEWLAQQQLGGRLYNIFDAGGYLLWRLYPSYRVMVDSRSFPYLDWFEDQYRFTRGEIFETFLHRYPADVAVIDLAKAPAWRNFLGARGWRPVFVGATAAIFVRVDDPAAAGISYSVAPGLEHVRNADVLLRVFDFAVDAGDWQTAWRLAERLQGPLARQLPAPVLDAVAAHRRAWTAARAGQYADALAELRWALRRKHPGQRDQAMLLLLQAMTVDTNPGSPQVLQMRAALVQLLAQRQ